MTLLETVIADELQYRSSGHQQAATGRRELVYVYVIMGYNINLSLMTHIYKSISKRDSKPLPK